MTDNKAFNGYDFSPEVNLLRYLQEIKKYPILSVEEEYALADEYRKNGNSKAAAKLINAHLRLVVKIVSKYKGYGLPVAEMIAEGNIGLLQAVNKFEPDRGFRFSTYAMWWIRASIQKYILNSWSLVKIGTTAAQKKLFFNLRKIKNRLQLNDDREMTNHVIRDIANSLDVDEQEVKDMNMRLRSHDGSLNIVLDSSSEEGAEWMDFISDGKPNQEEVYVRSQTMLYRRKLFAKALTCLNPREKDILFKRRLEEKSITLDDLSRIYSISKERVRQIELNSIKKMQKEIKEMEFAA